MHPFARLGLFAAISSSLILVSGCSGASGPDDAAVKACESAMKLRTQSGTMEERQALLDESLLQARMSKEPGLVDVVADADENAMGTIAFPDVVTVCRDLGYEIPDRE